MIGPVEKDIPMPFRKGRELSELTEKLITMRVGDSVRCTSKHEAQLVSNRLNQMGRKIVTRKESGGYRVWVTKDLTEP